MRAGLLATDCCGVVGNNVHFRLGLLQQSRSCGDNGFYIYMARRWEFYTGPSTATIVALFSDYFNKHTLYNVVSTCSSLLDVFFFFCFLCIFFVLVRPRHLRNRPQARRPRPKQTRRMADTIEIGRRLADPTQPKKTQAIPRSRQDH